MKKFECFKYTSGFALGLLSLFFLSCEEEFKVDMPDDIVNGIVFKGFISNDFPPYFFQLTKPAAFSAEYRSYEGIEDAQIVIEDVTAGIKDTLRLLEPRLVTGIGEGVYYNYYNYHTRKNEEKRVGDYEYSRSRGIYVTTKIYGREGHTYTLDIHYKGVHHTAKETMIPKTVMTDIKLKRFDLGEKGESWAPCISFANPAGVDNYYLLHVDAYPNWVFSISSLISSIFDTGESWGYSILSDEHLSDKVADLVVSDGESVRSLAPGSHYQSFRDSIFVSMESISKECYDIYNKYIEQIRTDGGAYTPTPTNVKSNISGDVWGCFRVSAYSEIGARVPR